MRSNGSGSGSGRESRKHSASESEDDSDDGSLHSMPPMPSSTGRSASSDQPSDTYGYAPRHFDGDFAPAMISTRQPKDGAPSHAQVPSMFMPFVLNIAILLRCALCRYIGTPLPNRLTNLRTYRKFGMIPRIWKCIIRLSGRPCEHYSFEEWCNARVGREVMYSELRALSAEVQQVRDLTNEEHFIIVSDAMASFFWYRQDAIARLHAASHMLAGRRAT